MNALDEYDIRTGFDAMDDDKLGTIGMDQFCTLYLGLGYPRLAQHQLEQYVRQVCKNYRHEVTKDMALQILSQVRVALCCVACCVLFESFSKKRTLQE
jgi:hypothetical protein